MCPQLTKRDLKLRRANFVSSCSCLTFFTLTLEHPAGVNEGDGTLSVHPCHALFVAGRQRDHQVHSANSLTFHRDLASNPAASRKGISNPDLPLGLLLLVSRSNSLEELHGENSCFDGGGAFQGHRDGDRSHGSARIPPGDQHPRPKAHCVVALT